MNKMHTRASGLMLNGGILFLGLLALVLLYALVSRSLSPSAAPEREQEADPALIGDIIQVEVLNGCGEAGLAGQATSYLRQHGFDVVGNGNYTAFDVEQSFVIDRVGNAASAQRVAQALGLTEDRIKHIPDPDLYLDVSIVLGKDYKQLPVFKE